MYFLVVDFEVRTADEEFSPDLSVTIYVAKNMFEATWNDTRVVCLAKHSVCLSATCLTVCENCTVIALNNRFDKWECALIVDDLLERVLIVDCIEGERLLIAFIIRLH